LGGTWHVWKPVLAALARHHRVLALTLPGHDGGAEYAGTGDATVAGVTDQLIAMLRARGIASAHIAGNSLGGWLSLELARRGVARSVTAFSPAGGWRTDADYEAVARPFRIFRAIIGIVIVLTTLFLGFAWLRRLMAKQTMEHGDRVPAQDFRDSMKAMKRNRVLLPLLRTMGRDGPVHPLAAKIPIRIAWSERDAVIPYERYGVPLLERIHGAERTIVPGVGHVPMYDDPDAVVANILEVTAKAEAASASQQTEAAA
jgi:pimeloyl-ACP methyl ester carboxylesterase